MRGGMFFLLTAHRLNQRRHRNIMHRLENIPKGYNDDGSVYLYTFEDHIRKIVADSPEYSSYIKTIFEEGFEIDKIDQKEIADKLDTMAPGLVESEKAVEEARKKIEESGIVISSPPFLPAMRFAEGEPYPPMQIGGYSYSNRGYDITFNGIKINRTIFENDGKQYQEQYDSHVDTYPNLEDEIEKLKRRISRRESIQRFPLMNTEGRQERIGDLYRQLRAAENDLKTRQKMEKELEAYKKLTPEQKGLIGAYLDAIDKSLEISGPIKELVDRHFAIGSRYTEQEIKRNRWERAKKSALENGKITEQQDNAFSEMIAAELAEIKSQYQDGLEAEDSKEEPLGESGPLEWLITARGIDYVRQEKERLKEEERTIEEAEALTEQRDKVLGQTGVNTTALEDKEKDEKDKKEEAEKAENEETEEAKEGEGRDGQE